MLIDNNTFLHVSCNCTSTEGVIYIILSFFGILENLLTALLIATDPELRNPTYYYMVNLCLADVVALVSIGVYQGWVLIDNRLVTFSITHPGVSLWLREVGVFETIVFMFSISLNRCRRLKSPQVVEQKLTKFHLWATIVGPWLIFPTTFALSIYYRWVPFTFSQSKFDWSYDSTKIVGRIFQNASIVYVFSAIVIISVLNLVSLFFVHKARKRIQPFVTDNNQKSEIKLFLQCALTTTITFTVLTVYGIIFSMKVDHVVSVIAHCGWIFTHLHSPMVYFLMNSRLRQRCWALMTCWRRTPQANKVNVRTVKVEMVQSSFVQAL